MAFILVLLVGLGVFDLKRMQEAKDKKQMILYCIFGVMTFAFGAWFLLNDMEHSFSYELFHLLGIIERQ